VYLEGVQNISSKGVFLYWDASLLDPTPPTFTTSTSSYTSSLQEVGAPCMYAEDELQPIQVKNPRRNPDLRGVCHIQA
jgi:hypothetical protein